MSRTVCGTNVSQAFLSVNTDSMDFGRAASFHVCWHVNLGHVDLFVL